MANLVDKSGDAYSNVVHGDGTNAATFPMPGNVALDVESVVATINNAAGGDTTPTLVVRDSSGEVIATKRMGDVIPAGGTGTATFSLRNADSTAGFIRYNVPNSGGFLRVRATGSSPTAYQVGSETSTWSVGISGDVVAVGADTNLFLTAQSAVEVVATDAVDVFTNGPFIVSALSGTHTYGAAFSFNVGTDFALAAVNSVSLSAANQEIDLQASGISVFLRTGTALTVFDVGGNPIFRVNEDGSLQGKTGKALVFNL